MSSVFHHLYQDSISKNANPSARRVEEFRRAQQESWQKKLAAQCHLSSESPIRDGSNSSRRINISSLSTSKLHRKKNMSNISKSKPDFTNCTQKSVSIYLNSDGSLVHTDYYLITDSVEPPPYKCSRPNNKFPPNTPRRVKQRIHQSRNSVRVSENRRKVISQLEEEVNLNKLPQEDIEESKMPLKDNLIEINPIVIADSIKGDKIKLNNGPKIMLDVLEPFEITEKPKDQLNLISGTGGCYQMYDYPNSLSFILQD